jgi:hypothetical protein
MILDAYLFDVSRATTATTLLICRSDALTDVCLNTEEKAHVCAAIEQRFAALNAGQIDFRSKTKNRKQK